MIKNDSTTYTKVSTQFCFGEINNLYRAEIIDIKIVNKSLLNFKCNSEVCFTKREFNFVMKNLELFT